MTNVTQVNDMAPGALVLSFGFCICCTLQLLMTIQYTYLHLLIILEKDMLKYISWMDYKFCLQLLQLNQI